MAELAGDWVVLDTHSPAHSRSVDRVIEVTIEVIELLRAAVAAVIDDHLETGTRAVIEGDYLAPVLATRHPRVRGLVLHEPDIERLVHDFAAREPDAGEQRTRAEVSARLSTLLSTWASTAGVPVITARPWPTVLDRAAAALRLPPTTAD